MRNIKNIVVHCTATPQTTSVLQIMKYWKDELKWKNPGYHYIITPTGNLVPLIGIDKIANGVAGHNAESIHISYIGGIGTDLKPKDTRTEAQKKTMLQLLKDLKAMFPDAKILGHRDFPGVAKACPSFDAKNEFKSL